MPVRERATGADRAAVLWGKTGMAMMDNSTIAFLSDLKEFANSSVVSSLFGALAGAWGGAFAVQKISQSARYRDEMLREIRSVNTSLHLLHTMAVAFLTFKEQHAKGLVKSYESQRAQAHEAAQPRQAGSPPPKIGFVNLSMIELLRPRLDLLETHALLEMTATGRILHLYSALAQTVQSLNYVIEQRNEFAAEASRLDKQELSSRLFGLPLPDGSIDDRYGHNVRAIGKLTDDCIYFSIKLMQQLESHGSRVRQLYVRRHDRNAPQVDRVRLLEKQALLPEFRTYRRWEDALATKVPPTDRYRRFARLRYALRLFARTGQARWRGRRGAKNASAV